MIIIVVEYFVRIFVLDFFLFSFFDRFLIFVVVFDYVGVGKLKYNFVLFICLLRSFVVVILNLVRIIE